MSRHARRTDSNQGDVVAALRAAGIWCHSTAALGNGFPDLLVWRNGFHLFELKDGTNVPSKRKLSPMEAAFALGCPGPVHVALCAEDVFKVLGLTVELARPVGNARSTRSTGAP